MGKSGFADAVNSLFCASLKLPGPRIPNVPQENGHTKQLKDAGTTFPVQYALLDHTADPLQNPTHDASQQTAKRIMKTKSTCKKEIKTAALSKTRTINIPTLLKSEQQ